MLMKYHFSHKQMLKPVREMGNYLDNQTTSQTTLFQHKHIQCKFIIISVQYLSFQQEQMFPDVSSFRKRRRFTSRSVNKFTIFIENKLALSNSFPFLFAVYMYQYISEGFYIKLLQFQQKLFKASRHFNRMIKSLNRMFEYIYIYNWH